MYFLLPITTSCLGLEFLKMSGSLQKTWTAVGTCVGDDLCAMAGGRRTGWGERGAEMEAGGHPPRQSHWPRRKKCHFPLTEPWPHPPEVTPVLVHGKLPAGPCRWGFTLAKIVCDQKGSILTPCWIYFCDLNSYFAAFVIVGIHSTCLREPLPSSIWSLN